MNFFMLLLYMSLWSLKYILSYLFKMDHPTYIPLQHYFSVNIIYEIRSCFMGNYNILISLLISFMTVPQFINISFWSTWRLFLFLLYKKRLIKHSSLYFLLHVLKVFPKIKMFLKLSKWNCILSLLESYVSRTIKIIKGMPVKLTFWTIYMAFIHEGRSSCSRMNPLQYVQHTRWCLLFDCSEKLFLSLTGIIFFTG